MEIIVTEMYYLKLGDYLAFIKMIHGILKKKGENRLWIGNGLYCLFAMFWIIQLKNSWHIFIPILILDILHILLYVFCLFMLYGRQKLINKLIRKQKKVKLVFEEKELLVFLCGTGVKQVFRYERVDGLELKDVFLLNVPIFLTKENIEGKEVINEKLKYILNNSKR